MNPKVKLLFVCTYNKMRSKTGEALYYDDPRFEVKSAGVDEDAEVRLSEELLNWADCTVVMEDLHVNWIRINCPEFEVEKRLISLEIPDRYFFMQQSLVDIMKERFETLYADFNLKNSE